MYINDMLGITQNSLNLSIKRFRNIITAKMQLEEQCSAYDLNDKPLETDKAECPVLSADLLKTIDEIAKTEGYIKHHADKKAISTEGGNYLGILYEIDLKGTTAHGKKETNLFIKHTIKSEHNKVLSVTEAYRRESFMYKKLTKIIVDLQDEAEIPEAERFNMPKCFAANMEAIVLQNLTKQGFKTYHRMDVMSLAFAKLCIQQLAKFHGIFYVLQEKRPEYFKRNLKVIKQPFACDKKEWTAFITNMCELSSSQLDENLKEKINKFVPMIFELFPLYNNITNGSTTVGCTICHGDYRVNNILAKENNGEPSKVVPIDYQLIYYGCPLNDFFYFVYTGSDYEFRKKYLNILKDLYYDSLTTFLNYFSLGVNEIFPRKEFERQFTERRDYGLMVSLYGVPFLFTLDDQVPDVGENDLSEITFVLDPRGHERIKSVVEEFVELGYL